MSNRLHVVPDNGEWKAVWEGSPAPVVRGPTQSVVEQGAKDVARDVGGAEVVVHRPDGRIRDSDTVGRPDPFPPRDTKH